MLHRITRRICYFLTRLYLYLFQWRMGLNKSERKQRIIVSLTTYSDRFTTAHESIKSMLMQWCKPDRIIVWLDPEVKVSDLPDKMLGLQKYGVEYIPIDGYLKPHKKYIHAMESYPNDIIVTVDDDLYYPPTLIDSLMKYHRLYPNCVCARRVHEILVSNNKVLPYDSWDGETHKTTKPSHKLLATGVGGVLYPPNCLPKQAFDYEAIIRLCLNADDIWLKCMELMNNTKVVWAKCIAEMPEAIEKRQKSNLRTNNVGLGNNDVYLKQVMNEYKISTDSLNDF